MKTRLLTLIVYVVTGVVALETGQAASELTHVQRLERLLGSKINPQDPSLSNIMGLFNQGQVEEALRQASYLDSFYKITVKNFATRMSVRSEEVSAPLNDFSATIIGIVRDDRNAREILTTNQIYWADQTRIPQGISIRNNFFNDVIRSNNHYLDIEQNLYRLSLKDILAPTPQRLQRANSNTTADLVDNPDPAGVLTSNTWGREHLVAGTNRRAVEYTLRAFLCTPMEEAADTGANDSRIGPDVDRFPGDNHLRFLTSCKGCHTVMDGFRGAFAKWHFDGQFLIHGSLHPNRRGMDAQGIATKMNQNSQVFPNGYRTQDDSWINYATRNKNAEHFTWQGATQGRGLRSFAQIVADSDRFALCMAKRVFNEVCSRSLSPYKNVSNSVTRELAQDFKSSGYNLRKLFIAAVTHRGCAEGGE